MEIYDISQEVFGCNVYPGDPSPKREKLLSISEGAVCNLTAFQMCAHNGTHVDAPYHFYDDGKTIDQVGLDRFVGYAYVAAHEGEITASDAEDILRAATQQAGEAVLAQGKDAATQQAVAEAAQSAAERILIKGKATLTKEGAEVFAKAGIKLFGNESQTVGPEDAPMEVHLIMLSAQIVLLEGIRLQAVPEGIYLLNAAPLNLGGADGAPCRAVLMKP
ncbi:MAG: cyclase family protein [Lachnospiraceae bacterium]|nr:cyclase family protein [Lachnospiraceae bacterium]